MAQPHKGDRELVASRVNRRVYETLKSSAAERNLSLSAYISDVLAQHTGHDTLVCALDQEVLPETA